MLMVDGNAEQYVHDTRIGTAHEYARQNGVPRDRGFAPAPPQQNTLNKTDPESNLKKLKGLVAGTLTGITLTFGGVYGVQRLFGEKADAQPSTNAWPADVVRSIESCWQGGGGTENNSLQPGSSITIRDTTDAVKEIAAAGTIVVDNGANVGTIELLGANAKVAVLSGTVGTITVCGANPEINVDGGRVGQTIAIGSNPKIAVGELAVVDEAYVSGSNGTVVKQGSVGETYFDPSFSQGR